MNYRAIKWAFGLLFVTGIVIATNLIDKRNFHQLGEAIENIYNDQLVAKDLIFELSVLIQEKTMAQVMSDSSFYRKRNFEANQKIDELLTSYKNTKLTRKEEQIFEHLSEDIIILEQLEVGSTSSNLQDEFFSNKKVIDQLNDIQDKLHVLSKIQIEEGRRQMLVGRTAIRSIDLYTKMEIYLLIALAIVIQLFFLSGLNLKKKEKRW